MEVLVKDGIVKNKTIIGLKYVLVCNLISKSLVKNKTIIGLKY